MATRKTTTKIDPIVITAAALRAIKTSFDYHRIGSSNPTETVTAAWEHLTELEQQRITEIVNNDVQPEPQAIADELASCGNKIELEAIKSTYGELAIKAAWKLLPQSERDRIKLLCENQEKEEMSPMIQEPTIYVESPSKLTKRNLIELTSDLQQLDELLDTIDGDNIPVDLQQAVDSLLQERDDTNEAVLEKLDNYCGLIQSRLIWAQSRKAEADRMARLAEADMKTVDFLKGRLKQHLEAIDQKKLRTKRFNISINGNGGKQPLRFDNTAPGEMPERFQRTTIEPDKEAIRTALEAGEDVGFAYLAERENHLRIK